MTIRDTLPAAQLRAIADDLEKSAAELESFVANQRAEAARCRAVAEAKDPTARPRHLRIVADEAVAR